MTSPVLEDVGHDLQLEDVPPVRRELPPLRPPGRPPRVAAAIAVVGALLAGIVAGVAPPAPLTWSITAGSVTSQDAVVTAGTLPLEARLVAGEDGAVLRAASATVELAPGTAVELQPAIGPAALALALEDGALVGDVDVTLSVDATVATVTGFGGAFRVERGSTDRVATYSAAVGITGDTATSMTRLSEVPLGGAQAAVVPIRLDRDDAWDRQYAEEVLAIEAQVADLEAGLAATYGTAPQTADFYDDFVGLGPGLVEALPQLSPVVRGDRFGPPGPTLVAAAAVTAIAQGTGRPLETILDTVVVDRAAGGTWGVLLARADLDGAYLRGVTDEALRRRAAQEDPAPVLPDESEAAEPTPPEPAPTPTPTPGPTPEPTPSPTPDPTPTPSPSPSPSPEPGPLEDPVGTIDDLLSPDGREGADPVGTLDGLLDDLPLVGGVLSVFRMLSSW